MGAVFMRCVLRGVIIGNRNGLRVGHAKKRNRFFGYKPIKIKLRKIIDNHGFSLILLQILPELLHLSIDLQQLQRGRNKKSGGGGVESGEW